MYLPLAAHSLCDQIKKKQVLLPCYVCGKPPVFKKHSNEDSEIKCTSEKCCNFILKDKDITQQQFFELWDREQENLKSVYRLINSGII